jgi:hypothetical protein
MVQRILGRSDKIAVVYVYSDKASADIARQRYAQHKCYVVADQRGEIEKGYRIRFVPSSFLIIKGRIVHFEDDVLSEEELARLLQSDLNKVL